MGSVIAIGESHQLEGFVLAGVPVIVATTDAEFNGAWRDLPADTALAILSPAAADALGPVIDERPDVLTAVMP